MIKKLLLVLSALVLTSTSAFATSATLSGGNCTRAQLQSAMTAATSANDFIDISACAAISMTSQVTWNVPNGGRFFGNNNGSLGGGDGTVLTDNDPTNEALFDFVLLGKFRMYGMTIQGGTGSLKDSNVIKISTTQTLLTDVRLHHMHVNMTTYSVLTNGNSTQFYGCIRGVIDHSIFEQHAIGNGPKISGGCGGGGYGDVEFNTATNPGSSDAMYFEDDTFTFDTPGLASPNDCFNGGKQVLRYNIMGQGGIQTHPTKPASRERGCRLTESLFNTFSGSNGSPNQNAHYISSGVAYIIGNTSSSGETHFLTLHSIRRLNPITYDFSAAPPTFFGACGTSYNGTGSNWDGNTSASTGYPCLDSPGRGVGDLLQGDFPNVVNHTRSDATSASANANPRQALEPIYLACTTFTTAGGGSLVSAYEPDAEVDNQDYYKDVGGVQSNATTPFNGSVGTGCGSRTNRPTSTLTNGVGFWALDAGGNWNTSNGTSNDGCLDIVVSGAWVNCVYTPYTYPHPLITADAGGACTPDHLTVTTQPSSAALNASLGSIVLEVRDSGGTLCSSATNSVTISKNASATWGSLAGTLTLSASGGIVTFTGLTVTTTTGAGAIDAASSGLTGATTSSITISAASNSVFSGLSNLSRIKARF